ncbi:MAG: DMT family transporter, partial [Candidatus Lambdaproteobacteria bacterium]|nr:DMT family transporter [Candidatus Lambdaproteobacteria bacterium]
AFPGLVTLLVFESNLRLGPTPTATLSATSPVFAVAGAILFIGERLTAPVVLGTTAVVAGIVLLSWRRGGGDRWRLPVLGLPLAGAVIRALAQVGTKLGLVLLPSPYVAGLVGYTLSVATLLAVARLRYRGRPIRLHRRGVPWFVLAGFCNGIAVLSLYTALNTGPVSVAAPIVATFPVFTLLFSVLFLRQEALRWPALAGVGLVVAGVVRIVV